MSKPTDHTPEKWEAECHVLYRAGTANHDIIADFGFEPAGVAYANAARAADCVNAMADIPDPEKWVQQAKEAIKQIENL